MARLVDNVADYLEARGIGTVGTDIFIGKLPQSPDDAIMVEATGGVEPDRDLPIKQPTIQILVRSTTYPNALDKATSIYDLLHRKGDDLTLVSGGVDVMYCFALQEPTHLGEDENGRHLFTCNYVFKLRS